MRRSVLRTALTVLTVGLLVAAGGLAAYAVWLRGEFDGSRRTIGAPFPSSGSRPAPVTGASANAQNILVVGTDSTGPGSGSDAQADMLLLIHVSADRRHVTGLTVPRNTLLAVPGGRRRVAYDLIRSAGVSGTVAAVERTVDVRIDHVAVLSFPGLVGLTDSLGGVTVDNPTAFRARWSGDTFPAGRLHLDGRRALAFLRGARDPSPAGDLVRLGCVKAYVQGVLRPLLTPDTVLNPVRTAAVVRTLSPYLRSDRGLNGDYLVGLAFSLSSVRPDDVRFVRLPDERGPGTSLAALQHAFRTDTLTGYAG